MSSVWRGAPPLSTATRAWLQCAGSLTERLRLHFPAVRVQPLRQSRRRPNRDECAALRLPRHQRVRVRDVVLHSGETALIFAHTVTPLSGLRGPWRALKRLGVRPLGELLFGQPRISREPLAYRALDARHPLYRAAAARLSKPPARLWARRARYRYQGAPLLVSEVFLPALWSAR